MGFEIGCVFNINIDFCVSSGLSTVPSVFLACHYAACTADYSTNHSMWLIEHSGHSPSYHWPHISFRNDSIFREAME